MQGNKLQKSNAKELRIANQTAQQTKAAVESLNHFLEAQNDELATFLQFVSSKERGAQEISGGEKRLYRSVGRALGESGVAGGTSQAADSGVHLGTQNDGRA